MKRTFTLVLTAVLALSVANASAQDLEELLTEVGESYAESYTSPFLYGFGPNQNANLFHTASIPWNRVTFGFAIKVMGTRLAEEDQTFRTVINDVDLNTFFPNDFAPGEQTGDIVMSGPTIFGDPDTDGTIKGYASGLEVASYETIPGLVDTRFVPLITPEFFVGGVYGVKALVRWLPEISAGDLGKTKYMGFGLQWNANGVLENLPVDIMVGFFNQKLQVGDILESKGSSLHLAVSKAYTAATVYAGFAKESSDMDITYTYIDDFDDADPANDIEQDISITTDGGQGHRFTLGATLNILANLNVEVGHGDMTTYSAGLLFGF